MCQLAGEHVGNDFHIAMWMRREARAARDRVVVKDAQGAPFSFAGS